MTVREIRAKSILRKSQKIDSWFISRYGMNLYRGCAHNCTYCDGRAEKYAVEGAFGEEVAVKINALELLRGELDPQRRRAPLRRSYILLGGGVGDSYQGAEAEYGLARKVLELLRELRWPVHVLTKSTLVERDLDVLASIHRESRAIVSMSFSSADDRISAQFEPGVPPPSERLKVLARCKRAGLPIGMFLMPVIPFVTDEEALMEETIRRAGDVGADFVVFGAMTLKEGRQKDYFLSALRRTHPQLEERFRKLYPGLKWGQAAGGYYDAVTRRFGALVRRRRIPPRIPPALFPDLLDPTDRAIVILEHLDYLYGLQGKRSPYGTAALMLSLAAQPANAQGELFTMHKRRELHPEAEAVLRELARTGRCALYERLLEGDPQA